MKTLLAIAPGFADEISVALGAEGHSALAAQLCNAAIERCTFDPEADAGYIYIKRQMSPMVAPFHREAAPVAKTIAFAAPHLFNVDVDHEGNAFGVELLGRPDVIALLRSANVL
jgi:uncharacterized protein YuzE